MALADCSRADGSPNGFVQSIVILCPPACATTNSAHDSRNKRASICADASMFQSQRSISCKKSTWRTAICGQAPDGRSLACLVTVLAMWSPQLFAPRLWPRSWGVHNNAPCHTPPPAPGFDPQFLWPRQWEHVETCVGALGQLGTIRTLWHPSRPLNRPGLGCASIKPGIFAPSRASHSNDRFG